ncbi:RNAse (barnase) inhibitor barstar [Kitasatospora gansuensis]|uniref:RNAse (Barnase) inhibitor barstar n=1 Tax=Kitasatospora gansuensis TaxID=258050 RepID=A0A7W7SI61_9ACTN|nr:barstar family protein [Kitasatospora gansuensis]MBB4949736.1 RNAse (barnase) inhibitor barstar [Kitasatospora gansuensis]
MPTTYHLRGAEITDEPSFYTALADALDAPDGYYGRNLDALADCLRGGYGPEAPFGLVWHDAGQARAALTRRLPGSEQRYFDALLEVLREGGVTVTLR